MRRRAIIGVLIAVVALPLLEAAQDLTSKDADSLERKLSAIITRALEEKADRRTALRTSITEREFNSYLKFSGSAHVPKGVVNPRVTIPGLHQIQARALVDLDAVRKSKERGWLDPMNLLSGVVELRAAGIFKSANGVGTFALESASLGSLPIPKSVVQELISYYSRTPENPAGFDLDKPFELPAGIREVVIDRGAALIVQ